MNINAAIIDQHLGKVVDEIREQASEELGINQEHKLKSLAFVYLCVRKLLDLDHEESFDCLTEGGNDFGVDAIHISEKNDDEFTVTLFQGKYKQNLEGNNAFDGNAIEKLIHAVGCLFDPSAQVESLNDRLRAKVEEARSFIRDGAIPLIRVMACNNGPRWSDAAEEAIRRFGQEDQVVWEHLNHDDLVHLIKQMKPVNTTLNFKGKTAIEDMNYSRVCIGRVPVSEIANLMKEHGDRLLERNIRRYLGLHGNRVNSAIRNTLQSKEPENFYFFNNGLTLVCTDFSYNALQQDDRMVKVENLQIVNGGQTSMTIMKTLEAMEKEGKTVPESVSVLVRLYKLPKDEDLALKITHATNSQNPVDLKDLKSNDERQKQLEQDIEGLGFQYRRKKMDTSAKANDITSGAAAEAVLSVWRQAPHQAKFLTREHFGKLYDKIFTNDLNGTQTILAVLLYRIAENHRKRPSDHDPLFVRYASCFIAMQMGKRLLKDLNIKLDQLGHQVFSQAKALVEDRGDELYNLSVSDIQEALTSLYGVRDSSMQQLSATFRRGDLIEKLSHLPLDEPNF